jgi:hypothetical protein
LVVILVVLLAAFVVVDALFVVLFDVGIVVLAV